MTRVQPKAMPNWCLQVKPDEPWTGRCVKEKTTTSIAPKGLGLRSRPAGSARLARVASVQPDQRSIASVAIAGRRHPVPRREPSALWHVR